MTRVLTTLDGKILTDTDAIQEAIINAGRKGLRKTELQDKLRVDFTFAQWLTLRDFLKLLGYQESPRAGRGKAWCHPYWFNKQIPREILHTTEGLASFKNLIPKKYFNEPAHSDSDFFVPKVETKKERKDNHKKLMDNFEKVVMSGMEPNLKNTSYTPPRSNSTLMGALPDNRPLRTGKATKGIPTITMKVPAGTRVVIEYE